MNKLETLDRTGLRTDIPDFKPGDTIRVMVKNSTAISRSAPSFLRM